MRGEDNQSEDRDHASVHRHSRRRVSHPGRRRREHRWQSLYEQCQRRHRGRIAGGDLFRDRVVEGLPAWLRRAERSSSKAERGRKVPRASGRKRRDARGADADVRSRRSAQSARGHHRDRRERRRLTGHDSGDSKQVPRQRVRRNETAGRRSSRRQRDRNLEVAARQSHDLF